MDFEDNIVRRLSTLRSTRKIDVTSQKKVLTSDLFYVRKEEKYKYIKHRLMMLKKGFLELLELEDFFPVNHLSLSSFTTYGVITRNMDHKLTYDNVFLCSLIDDSNDFRLKLNLNYLKHFSLFPGQIVAITGKNVKGNEIIVQKIHSLPFLDYNIDAFSNYNKYSDVYTEKPLEINFVAGPFSDDEEYLFLDKLFENTPDVFVLVGPFIDKQFENLNPEEIFYKKIMPKIEKWLLKSMSSKIILIPSINDLNTLGLFPQDKFNYNINNERILLFSNPSCFKINEILFGCCSFDNLLYIGREEFSYENKEAKVWEEDKCSEVLFGKDRMNRIFTHLIFQQSFLPVFPVKEAINYNNPHNLDMKIAPDFLITCSLFKESSRSIGPVTAINLGTQKKTINKKLAKIIISKPLHGSEDDENWIKNRTKVEFKDVYDSDNNK